MSKTIVIAFDGLDKELIEKFDLEHIPQQEFGSIDNHSDTFSIKTSELFTNFITGKTWKEHGIKKLKTTRYPNKKKEKIIEALTPEVLRENLRGTIAFRDVLEQILRANPLKERYSKKHLEVETLFEEIEDSRAMYVPGYNPDMLWRLHCGFSPIKHGYSKQEQTEYWDERSYEIRREKLFSELENDIIPARDFLMCHFHRPDLYQHIYGDRQTQSYDEEALRRMYEETDRLAGEIKEKALEKGYENIIFMSDHGRPAEGGGHNKNAFYSSNIELFQDTPKIRDFHDKILELT